MHLPNRIETGLNIALAMLVLVALIYGVGKFGAWRDAQLSTQMKPYEDCVQEQYHTTPAAWYAEHGELPACPTQ